ncbi:protein disulfide oxidoreductase [Forsythia ovata]|uniref:Protein disulfide oxidoreductase n=1 Tax=Forsythia ovata TaxID=205694 RepID=A0ABD1PVM4_9LAMI
MLISSFTINNNLFISPKSSSIGSENEEMEQSVNNSAAIAREGKVPDRQTEDLESASTCEKPVLNSPSEKNEVDMPDTLKDEQEKESPSEESKLNTPTAEKLEGETVDIQKEKQVESQSEMKSLEVGEKISETESEKRSDGSKEGENDEVDSRGTNKNLEEILYGVEEEPVFDGTEIPGMEANRSLSMRSSDHELEGQGSAWPEKAVALTNFLRAKSAVAVSTFMRRLSVKSDSGQDVHGDAWGENKAVQDHSKEDFIQPIAMKGRIMLYTRLGCQDCKETRRFLHEKRLRYVEINIDVYPSRKLELEKIIGSNAVPRVFFNEALIGGLAELKSLEESGKLGEKIEYVVAEAPSFEAPLPPLSGEDDLSSSGAIDELALIVRKMKGTVSVKDRFYKLRRFTNCFLGSEAVDFLSEDQYLEREEAVEFGRKLASKLFFQHVLDNENIFEDGNHLYRFLDDDPLVSQCQNIPRGIIEVKPKPIIEISSRLRFLSYAILEAYASEDGKHVDYRSIHGSEEFARYLRITEELQRVELCEMPREENLAFFINLYNMMAIHAILVWGQPSGALERRKLYGDFKYVIGGLTYSLSAIYNGILRGNQRPPYNLIKPFSVKDKQLKVALPCPEPLVHFALVCGTRSGPALRCYSPQNIDEELIDAARNFLRTGGLYVDLIAHVAYVSKILRWYSVDFGRNEVEVLKHAAIYLEPEQSQALLELLSNTQLKVIYQPYDWGLNH